MRVRLYQNKLYIDGVEKDFASLNSDDLEGFMENAIEQKLDYDLSDQKHPAFIFFKSLMEETKHESDFMKKLNEYDKHYKEKLEELQKMEAELLQDNEETEEQVDEVMIDEDDIPF